MRPSRISIQLERGPIRLCGTPVQVCACVCVCVCIIGDEQGEGGYNERRQSEVTLRRDRDIRESIR